MPKKKYFSKDVPFINRENEKEYILEYLNSTPASILFMYWPKSSGKTTLINKVIDELPSKHLVSSTNFRWYLIANYDSFINIMFRVLDNIKLDAKWFLWKWYEILTKNIWEKYQEYKRTSRLNLFKLFNITTEIKKKMEEKELDPFEVMESILKDINKKWYKPVLIFDEIQELKDIYMNGDKIKKALLNEMFAFFIRLTKELKLAHVICMTSESTFVDEIYNHVKLKNTSKFYMLDHLKREDVYEWLEAEWLEQKEIRRIWKNLWWSPQEIWMVLVDFKNWMKLKDVIDERIQVEVGRIADLVKSSLSNSELKKMIEINKEIIKKWSYKEKWLKDVSKDLINKLVEKDIWFYDTINMIITANSESVRQAFKKIQKLA